MITIVDTIEEANCITHSGTMHADEVFATAFLHQYMGDLRVYRVSDVDWSKVNKDTIVSETHIKQIFDNILNYKLSDKEEALSLFINLHRLS